jgi:hypothetical protein
MKVSSTLITVMKIKCINSYVINDVFDDHLGVLLDLI